MKKVLLFILAVMLAVPALASAADKLPAGFIALSDKEMNWNDAVAWCKQQGRKLPQINNSDSLALASPDISAKITHIDGFGAHCAPWPSGLPDDSYWTGTEYTVTPGNSWAINYHGDQVVVTYFHQSVAARAVCVP